MTSGGVANTGSGTLTATASTLAGNVATEFGGGLYATEDTTLENVTISGNEADSNGGGIFVGLTTVTVTNSTIVTNTAAGAGSGGGINNLGGAVTVKNTIVADNAEDNCGGAITSAGHNLEDADTCDFDAAGDQANTDPMLEPLADNGGSTPTHALLSGSPAIDAGDDAACPATDQRGVSRPADGDLDGTAICDIGAFEYAPTIHTLYLPVVVKQ